MGCLFRSEMKKALPRLTAGPWCRASGSLGSPPEACYRPKSVVSQARFPGNAGMMGSHYPEVNSGFLKAVAGEALLVRELDTTRPAKWAPKWAPEGLVAQGGCR